MRLEDPAAIYQALAALQVGDAVPEQVYILDERNGTIPRWVVVWRKDLPDTGQVLLILEDQTVRPDVQPSLFAEAVHKGILTWNRKTLGTREYASTGTPEWTCPRSTFCDMGQQARIENRRQRRARKEAA